MTAPSFDFGRMIRTLVKETLSRQRVVNRRQAIVTAVNTGPPKTVTYKFDAADAVTKTARYMNHYATPAVNDVVFIDYVDGDAIVQGKLA